MPNDLLSADTSVSPTLSPAPTRSDRRRAERRESKTAAPSALSKPKTPSAQAKAIIAGAKALGIDPVDYATAMLYETSGTLDPWQMGPVTKWGQHRGTIQYGEPQRKKYGVYAGQTFDDQVMNSNVRYLRDRGVKPGATFREVYAAINGGNVNAKLSTPDADTGRTISDNISLAEKQWRGKARELLGLGPDETYAGNPYPEQIPVDVRQTSRYNAPTGGGDYGNAEAEWNWAAGMGEAPAIPSKPPVTFKGVTYERPAPSAGNGYYKFQETGRMGNLEYLGVRDGAYWFKDDADDLYKSSVGEGGKLQDPEVVGIPNRIELKGGRILHKDENQDFIRMPGATRYQEQNVTDGVIGDPTIWLYDGENFIPENPYEEERVNQEYFKFLEESKQGDSPEMRQQWIDAYNDENKAKAVAAQSEEEQKYIDYIDRVLKEQQANPFLLDRPIITDEDVLQYKINYSPYNPKSGSSPEEWLLGDIANAMTNRHGIPYEVTAAYIDKYGVRDLKSGKTSKTPEELEKVLRRGEPFLYSEVDVARLKEFQKMYQEVAKTDFLKQMAYGAEGFENDNPLMLINQSADAMGMSVDEVIGKFLDPLNEEFSSALRMREESVVQLRTLRDQYAADALTGNWDVKVPGFKPTLSLAQARAQADMGIISRERYEALRDREVEAQAELRAAEQLRYDNKFWIDRLTASGAEYLMNNALFALQSLRPIGSGKSGWYGLEEGVPMPKSNRSIQSRIEENLDQIIRTQWETKNGFVDGATGYAQFLKENALEEFNFVRQLKYSGRVVGGMVADAVEFAGMLEEGLSRLNPGNWLLDDSKDANLRNAVNAVLDIYGIITGQDMKGSHFKDSSPGGNPLSALANEMREIIGRDQYLEQSNLGKANAAFVNAAMFMVGGSVLRGSKLGIAALGTALEAPGMYKQLTESGVDPEKALWISLGLGSVSGTSELLGFGKFLNRFGKLGENLKSESVRSAGRAIFKFSLAEGTKELPEEMIQEGVIQGTLIQSIVDAIADPEDKGFAAAFLSALPERAVESREAALYAALGVGAVAPGAAAIQGRRFFKRVEQNLQDFTPDQMRTFMATLSPEERNDAVKVLSDGFKKGLIDVKLKDMWDNTVQMMNDKRVLRQSTSPTASFEVDDNDTVVFRDRRSLKEKVQDAILGRERKGAPTRKGDESFTQRRLDLIEDAGGVRTNLGYIPRGELVAYWNDRRDAATTKEEKERIDQEAALSIMMNERALRGLELRPEAQADENWWKEHIKTRETKLVNAIVDATARQDQDEVERLDMELKDLRRQGMYAGLMRRVRGYRAVDRTKPKSTAQDTILNTLKDDEGNDLRVPEAPETIEAQISAIGKGKRQIVVVPRGMDGKASPHIPTNLKERGLDSIETEVGTVIFDPKVTNKNELRLKSRTGNRIAFAAAQGFEDLDTDVGTRGRWVIARDAQGRELSSVYTKWQHVGRQIKEFQAQFGEEVDVEILTPAEAMEKIIPERMAAAEAYEQKRAEEVVARELEKEQEEEISEEEVKGEEKTTGETMFDSASPLPSSMTTAEGELVPVSETDEEGYQTVNWKKKGSYNKGVNKGKPLEGGGQPVFTRQELLDRFDTDLSELEKAGKVKSVRVRQARVSPNGDTSLILSRVDMEDGSHLNRTVLLGKPKVVPKTAPVPKQETEQKQEAKQEPAQKAEKKEAPARPAETPAEKTKEAKKTGKKRPAPSRQATKKAAIKVEPVKPEIKSLQVGDKIFKGHELLTVTKIAGDGVTLERSSGSRINTTLTEMSNNPNYKTVSNPRVGMTVQGKVGKKTVTGEIWQNDKGEFKVRYKADAKSRAKSVAYDPKNWSAVPPQGKMKSRAETKKAIEDYVDEHKNDTIEQMIGDADFVIEADGTASMNVAGMLVLSMADALARGKSPGTIFEDMWDGKFATVDWVTGWAKILQDVGKRLNLNDAQANNLKRLVNILNEMAARHASPKKHYNIFIFTGAAKPEERIQVILQEEGEVISYDAAFEIVNKPLYRKLADSEYMESYTQDGVLKDSQMYIQETIVKLITGQFLRDGAMTEAELDEAAELVEIYRQGFLEANPNADLSRLGEVEPNHWEEYTDYAEKIAKNEPIHLATFNRWKSRAGQNTQRNRPNEEGGQVGRNKAKDKGERRDLLGSLGQSLGDLVGDQSMAPIKTELRSNPQRDLKLKALEHVESGHQSFSSVLIKEVMQNSIDGIRDRVKLGEIAEGEGVIEVTYPLYDNDEAHKRTLTIKDNGIGMTPEILTEAFTVLGGTHKESAGTGSKGYAKAVIFLFNGQLETVRSGTGIKNKLSWWTNPETQEIEFSDITREPTTDPPGTQIKFELPTHINNFAGEPLETKTLRFFDSYQFFQAPLLYPVTVQEKTNAGISKLAIGKYWDPDNFELDRRIEFPNWGYADIWITKDKSDKSYPDRFVLMRGLYQFNHHYSGILNMNSIKEEEKYPYDIIVDLHPFDHIEGADPLYPVNNSRTNFRGGAHSEDFKRVATVLLAEENNKRQRKLGEELVAKFSDIKTTFPTIEVSEGNEVPEEVRKSVEKVIQSQEQRKAEEAEREIGERERARQKREAEEKAREERKRKAREKQTKTRVVEPDQVTSLDTMEKETGIEVEETETDTGEKLIKSNVKVEMPEKVSAADYLRDASIAVDETAWFNLTNVDFLAEFGDEAFAFLTEFGSVMQYVKKEFLENGPWEARDFGKKDENAFFLGILIDMTSRGMTIEVPFKAVMVNPLTSKFSAVTARGFAWSYLSTTIHELAHIVVFYAGHKTPWSRLYEETIVAFGDKGITEKALAKFEGVLERHADVLEKMRKKYNERNTVNIMESFEGIDETARREARENEIRLGTGVVTTAVTPADQRQYRDVPRERSEGPRGTPEDAESVGRDEDERGPRELEARGEYEDKGPFEGDRLEKDPSEFPIDNSDGFYTQDELDEMEQDAPFHMSTRLPFNSSSPSHAELLAMHLTHGKFTLSPSFGATVSYWRKKKTRKKIRGVMTTFGTYLGFNVSPVTLRYDRTPTGKIRMTAKKDKAGKVITETRRGEDGKWIRDENGKKVQFTVKVPVMIQSPVLIEARIDQILEQMVGNIEFLYQLAVERGIDREAAYWYDGARKIASRWAKRYELTTPQMAGIIAAISPQKEWESNLAEAEYLVQMAREFGVSNPTVTKEDVAILRKEGKPEDAIAGLTEAIGQKWNTLSRYQQVYYIHSYLLKNPNAYRTVYEWSPKGVRGKASPNRVPWFGNGYGFHVNALTILNMDRMHSQETDHEVISRGLGNGHKVRAFFNNILLPRSAGAGDVTVDTHAVGAAHFRPLSSKAPEVGHAMGGPPSNDQFGLRGMSGLYAEAYRIAAKNAQIRPREMQSIAWVMQRYVFPANARTAANNESIDQIWRDYDGKTDISLIRAEVLRTAEENARQLAERTNNKGTAKKGQDADQGELASPVLRGQTSKRGSRRGADDDAEPTLEARGKAVTPQSLFEGILPPVTLSIFDDPAFQNRVGMKVKRGTIEQVINQKGRKKPEQDLARGVLDTVFEGQDVIDFNAYVAAVRMAALPLHRIETPENSDPGWDSVDLPDGGLDSYSIVFNSPVLMHGLEGHFPETFAASYRPGMNTPVVIETPIPGLGTVYTVYEGKAGAVRRFEDNIILATTDKALAEQTAENFKYDSESLFNGLFGHARVGEVGDTNFVISEIQSDVAQKQTVRMVMVKQALFQYYTGKPVHWTQADLFAVNEEWNQLAEYNTDEAKLFRKRLKKKSPEAVKAIEALAALHSARLNGINSSIWEESSSMRPRALESMLSRRRQQVDEALRLKDRINEVYNLPKKVWDEFLIDLFTRLSKYNNTLDEDVRRNVRNEVNRLFHQEPGKPQTRPIPKAVTDNLGVQFGSHMTEAFVRDLTNIVESYALALENGDTLASQGNNEPMTIEDIVRDFIPNLKKEHFGIHKYNDALKNLEELENKWGKGDGAKALKWRKAMAQAVERLFPLIYKGTHEEQFAAYERIFDERILREVLDEAARVARRKGKDQKVYFPTVGTAAAIQWSRTALEGIARPPYRTIDIAEPGELVRGDMIEMHGDTYYVVDGEVTIVPERDTERKHVEEWVAELSEDLIQDAIVTLIGREGQEITSTEWHYILKKAGLHESFALPYEVGAADFIQPLDRFVLEIPDHIVERVHDYFEKQMTPSRVVEHFQKQGRRAFIRSNFNYRDINDADIIVVNTMNNREMVRQPGEYVLSEPNLNEAHLSQSEKTILKRYEHLGKKLKQMRPDVTQERVGTKNRGYTDWLVTTVKADEVGPVPAFSLVNSAWNRDISDPISEWDLSTQIFEAMGEIMFLSKDVNELAKKASISLSANGIAIANAEMTLLLSTAGDIASSGEAIMLGGYIPSNYARYMQVAISQKLTSVPFEDKMRVLTELNAVMSASDDFTWRYEAPNHPLVGQLTEQEELAHRADARLTSFQPADRVPFEKSKAYNYARTTLSETYDTASADMIHNEIIAKSFRDNAALELGLSNQEVDEIRDLYINDLRMAGITAADVEKEFADISRRGKEFAERYAATQTQETDTGDESVRQEEPDASPPTERTLEARSETGGQYRRAFTTDNIAELADGVTAEEQGEHLKLSPEAARFITEGLSLVTDRQAKQPMEAQFITWQMRNVIDGLINLAEQLEAAGFTEAAERADALREAIEQKMEEDGTAILVLNDKYLPHERFHKASWYGAKGGSLLTRIKDGPTVFFQNNRDIITKAFEAFFGPRGYQMLSEMDRAEIIEEMAAWIATSTPEEIEDLLGITFDEAVEYLFNWFTAYEAQNGPDSLSNFDEFFRQFESANQALGEQRARRTYEQAPQKTDTRNRQEATEERGGGLGEFQGRVPLSEAGSFSGRSKEEQRDLAARHKKHGDEVLRRLSTTLAESGMRVPADYYIAQGNTESVIEADNMLRQMITEGGLEFALHTVRGWLWETDNAGRLMPRKRLLSPAESILVKRVIGELDFLIRKWEATGNPQAMEDAARLEAFRDSQIYHPYVELYTLSGQMIQIASTFRSMQDAYEFVEAMLSHPEGKKRMTPKLRQKILDLARKVVENDNQRRVLIEQREYIKRKIEWYEAAENEPVPTFDSEVVSEAKKLLPKNATDLIKAIALKDPGAFIDAVDEWGGTTNWLILRRDLKLAEEEQRELEARFEIEDDAWDTLITFSTALIIDKNLGEITLENFSRDVTRYVKQNNPEIMDGVRKRMRVLFAGALNKRKTLLEAAERQVLIKRAREQYPGKTDDELWQMLNDKKYARKLKQTQAALNRRLMAAYEKDPNLPKGQIPVTDAQKKVLASKVRGILVDNDVANLAEDIINGKAAPEMLRKNRRHTKAAKRAIEQAKREIVAEQAAIKSEVAGDRSTLREIEAEIFQANERGAQQRRDINNAMAKADIHAWRWRAGEVWKAMSEARAVMAGADFSGALRQGIWATFYEPQLTFFGEKRQLLPNWQQIKAKFAAMYRGYAGLTDKQQQVLQEWEEAEKIWFVMKDWFNEKFRGMPRQRQEQILMSPWIAQFLVAVPFSQASETRFADMMARISNHAEFDTWRRVMKVDFAIAGNPALMGAEGLGTNEERIHTEYARNFRVPKFVPLLGGRRVFGHLRWSERTWAAFLDNQRALLAHKYYNVLQEADMQPEEFPEEYRAMGQFINYITGKTDILDKASLRQKTLEWAKLANIMFAASYAGSRAQAGWHIQTFGLLQPGRHTENRVAYKYLRRKIASTNLALGLMYSILSALGFADWEWDDPRSFLWENDDFLKLKRAGAGVDGPALRMEVFGGVTPFWRLEARLFYRAIAYTIGGPTGLMQYPYRGEGFLADGEYLVRRYARGKSAPMVALIHDFIAGEDFLGRKVDITDWRTYTGTSQALGITKDYDPRSAGKEFAFTDSVILQRIFPLIAKEVLEGTVEDGWGGILVTPSIVGLQTSYYQDRKPIEPLVPKSIQSARTVWKAVDLFYSAQEDPSLSEAQRKRMANALRRKLRNTTSPDSARVYTQALRQYGYTAPVPKDRKARLP